jgi:hypothetical protein
LQQRRNSELDIEARAEQSCREREQRLPNRVTRINAKRGSVSFFCGGDFFREPEAGTIEQAPSVAQGGKPDREMPLLLARAKLPQNVSGSAKDFSCTLSPVPGRMRGLLVKPALKAAEDRTAVEEI